VETVEADDVLLDGVRAGTPDWGRIYLAHRKAMYHAAAWVLEGQTHAGVSASDVVQKVVIELQRLGLPTDARDLGALLVRRTIQRAYDELRRARRHPTIPLGEDAQDLADERADVERIALARLRLECARRELPGLPPRERHALVERVMKARPANEVAGELQVTPQRVSQLVNQAIRKLRAKCDPTEDDHA
jgi:RNA polymerase sigma factor (sigma-70 family)